MNQQQKSMNKAVRCYYGYSKKENQIPSKWTEFENLAGISEVTPVPEVRLIVSTALTLSFFVKSKEGEDNIQTVEREATRLCDIMNKDGFWIKIRNVQHEQYAKITALDCHVDIPMPDTVPILYVGLVY